MCILMVKNLAVFKNSVPLLQRFWVKNAKKTFLKKKSFGVVFVKSKCMWLQTGLRGLKNTEQLKFC